jgi:hypothetical protein
MSESIETTTAVSFESSQSTPSIREVLEQRDRQAKKERLDFLENAAKSLLTEDEIQECMDNGDMDYSKLEETLKEKGEEETAVELINAVLRMQEEQDESDLRFLSTRLTSLVHCGDLQGKKTKKDKEVLVSLRETRELAWERKGYHRQELEFIGAGIKAYNGGIYALKTVKKNTEERTKHGNTELVERYFVTKALPRLKATTPSVHELPEIIGIKSALGGENYINVMPVDSIGDAEGRKKTPKTILMTTYTSMFFNKAEKLDAEAPQKRVVLYFDRDETRQDITKMSNEEKQAFYADEIKEVVGVFEEFWGVKPYQIHLSRNGYHIVCPISEAIGYNDKGLEHALKIASSNPDVASILKKGQEDLRSLFGSRESNELGHADAIGEVYYPIFCSIVSDRLREKGLYSDKKNYFDLACRNINRQMVDIGMCNYKEVDSDGNIRVYPIEPVFKELTSVNSKNKYVSLETINFELVNSNQKYILEIANEVIREKNISQKNHLSGKDRVFTANKTEEQLAYIRDNGLLALQKDSFIQFILDFKLELSKEAWWKLAQIIAIFSNPAIKSLSDDPAYGLFEKISRVNKYAFKAAYNQGLTFIRACESIMDGDTLDWVQKYTFETIINSEIGRNKNLETLKGFARYKENGRKEKNRSLFMNAMNEIRSKYNEKYKSSIYDSAGKELFFNMGLEMDSEGRKPLNTPKNFGIILERDPIINKAFRVNTFSNVIMVHTGLVKHPPLASSPETIEDQILSSLDIEFENEHTRWEAPLPTDYVWTSLRLYINEKYDLDRCEESISIPLASKLLAEAMPNKDLFINPIYEAFSNRYEDWVKVGKPKKLDSWLADSLYVNKEQNPNYYKRLQIIGRKLVLTHMQRALTPNKSGIKSEYLTITCGATEGTGKSTLGNIALAAIFGEVRGEKNDKIIDEMTTPYGGGDTGVNLFKMSDDKREGILVRGSLIANVDEIDQFLVGKKEWASVKAIISQSNYSGVPIFGKNKETIPYRFCLYGSSNRRDLLQQQSSTHRRFLIIDLDYENESNPDEYAVGLVERNSKKKTPKHFKISNSGNGVDNENAAGKYAMDISLMCRNMSLAFGEAFQQLNETWDIEEKDRLDEEGRLEYFPRLLKSGKEGKGMVEVEKLNLTVEEQGIIGEGNRNYEHVSEVTTSLVLEAVKNYEYRVLTPQILEGQDTLKSYPQYQKEKFYSTLVTTMLTKGLKVDEHRTLKIEKKKFKVSSTDASTPGSNLSGVIGMLITGPYVFVYETKDASGKTKTNIVGDGCKPFQRLDKNDGLSLSILDDLDK